MTELADVAVIGAGVVGLGVARRSRAMSSSPTWSSPPAASRGLECTHPEARDGGPDRPRRRAIRLAQVHPTGCFRPLRYASSRGGAMRSQLDFEAQFASEADCLQYLREMRWPGGFSCPRCSGPSAWELHTSAVGIDSCAAWATVATRRMLADSHAEREAKDCIVMGHPQRAMRLPKCEVKWDGERREWRHNRAQKPGAPKPSEDRVGTGIRACPSHRLESAVCERWSTRGHFSTWNEPAV